MNLPTLTLLVGSLRHRLAVGAAAVGEGVTAAAGTVRPGRWRVLVGTTAVFRVLAATALQFGTARQGTVIRAAAERRVFAATACQTRRVMVLVGRIQQP